MHSAGLLKVMIRQDFLRMVATPAFVLCTVAVATVTAFQFMALDVRILAEADPPAAARVSALFATASGTYTFHLPPSALCYIAMQRMQAFWLAVPLLAGRVVASDAKSGYRCLRAVRGTTRGAQAVAAAAASALMAATLCAAVVLAITALCAAVSCGSDAPEYFAALREALAADLPAPAPVPLYASAGAYRLAVVGILFAVFALGGLSGWLSFWTGSAAAPAALGVACALSPYLPIYALNDGAVPVLTSLGFPAELAVSVDFGLFGAGFPVPSALAPNLPAWAASAAWFACEAALLAGLAYATARVREGRWGR